MTATLWRASLRYSLRHPWQLGLSLLGIALGVAVVVSIDLTIDSARRAFVLSNETVLGAATHRLRGGPVGIDENLYVGLRARMPELRAAPVVEGYVAGDDGVALRILGVDVFAEAPFRPRLRDAATGARDVLAPLMTDPGAVLVSTGTAARLGVAVGGRFRVLVNGRHRELTLVGVLEPADDLGRASLADIVVADIATAQELLGRVGRLSQVDLRLAEGEPDAVAAMLPAGVRLERAGTGTRLAERMTGAFNLNLVMLGLLAVMVGMFLVYNTVTFSVVQRRQLIGVLRVIGVTRNQIFTLVLVEAALVAAVAVAAGLALGVVLAEQLVTLVSRTINDLYFAVSVRELTVTPTTLAKGAAVGFVAALAAAAVPAFEATRIPPRSAMARSLVEVRAHRRLPMVTMAGALALGLADERINEIAFACEKIAHGTPSGVDNTVATYARPMLFRNVDGLEFKELELKEPPPLVIASCDKRGSTHEQVAGVRARYDHSRESFAAIFEQIDSLSVAGADALSKRDYGELGRHMNINHGLLNAIGVSTAELEQMIDIARAAGAIGAKLTGAGGGGSIVALCPQTTVQVSEALRSRGYRVMEMANDKDEK